MLAGKMFGPQRLGPSWLVMDEAHAVVRQPAIDGCSAVAGVDAERLQGVVQQLIGAGVGVMGGTVGDRGLLSGILQ